MFPGSLLFQSTACLSLGYPECRAGRSGFWAKALIRNATQAE